MTFTQESDFENALVEMLTNKGWEKKIIEYPTEDELLKNWAAILFENNRSIDRLNDVPLTDTEMQQIIEQITTLRTPLALNGFINGKSVAITRDNPADTLHQGKEVSLYIYDRHEIAAGLSRYQIVRQPRFKSKSKILNDRRGDLMLLINGMPVIHIELKKSGVSVSQAYHQIEKYAHENIFSGLFSLIQIFVAMEPAETVYFANPGPDGFFNPNFYFHWANFNNEPVNDWKEIASTLLSIPMAHQLIGFYTVADNSDGVLKVMRSYQYYAANAISDKVSKTDWSEHTVRGGYIWHTTGSGKTMTSFKSAQLIASSKDADKVVFLMDRIELGTQSLKEYRGFASKDQEVQETEDTVTLIGKLKSPDSQNTLIVTSIQKMSNIKAEEHGRNEADIAVINKKRIVFIVDEAHRSTFGDMLVTIKETFPHALFFGFTGTPIQEENQKKTSTTATVFGNELHRYSIADGIRDKNVLGFDTYKVLTYKDTDIRKVIALQESKADSEEDAVDDEKKRIVYYRFMDASQVPMAGYTDNSGTYIKGIEDYLNRSQYERKTHQQMVIHDIQEHWITKSVHGKFHAIFATSSITEAIQYYRLIKKEWPSLQVTALFDPNIDNNGSSLYKEDGLVEIIQDYNTLYNRDFSLATHAQFKKEIAARLAHKKPFEHIEQTPDQQINIVIVVDQMLTGFDSKWINTLYLDKVLHYENIIQAFSRTNRLFGPDKPFGTIRYYRFPHTMEQNIKKAVKLYSGDRPFGLFVEQLDTNLNGLNKTFTEIKDLFNHAAVKNLEKLPEDVSERGQFAKLFKTLNTYLEAAKIQGFSWDTDEYTFETADSHSPLSITLDFDQTDYLTLAIRYKELFEKGSSTDKDPSGNIPFEIDGYLTEIPTDKINSDYMNSRFDKYFKLLSQEHIDPKELEQTLDDLHKSFSSLTQEEQKYANIFLHDVQNGDIQLENGKTFREYITEYQEHAKNDQIYHISHALGLEEKKLRDIMSSKTASSNIDEFGRFEDLKQTVDKTKAKLYFEEQEGISISPFSVNMKVDKLLREFIQNDGFDIETKK
ncbi:MAG: HsdR family type I site-specific deoxyribonuclease [Treponema sp.]|jgi:type I restriction enzyme R subunit|nr:HsdR family type I site-specific deoxyribonuclease [Treponema sp.]